MKLRIYFLLVMCTGILLSCSKDNEELVVPVFEPDATLSLAASIEGETKTKAETIYDTSDDAKIYSLQLLVFSSSGGTVTYQTSAYEIYSDGQTFATLEDISVESGNVSLLVVANCDKITDLTFGVTTLNEVLAKSTSLEAEGQEKKGYTMSSQVYNYSIVAGAHNTIGSGFESHTPGTSLSATPVELVRNVAKINLMELTMKSGNGYELPEGGIPVSFSLDTIYVANVKNKSAIASTGFWGAVEQTHAQNAWWFGAISNETGAYSSVTGAEKDFLCYNAKAQGLTEVVLTTDAKTHKVTIGDVRQPIGKPFLVYENMARNGNNEIADGEQTLLIVRGDYTYKDKNTGVEITKYDRYYAVPVNNPAYFTNSGDIYTGIDKHNYIKRNVKYNVYLTLTGTGSTKPYDKDAIACISMSIQVQDWSVVEMNEKLD